MTTKHLARRISDSIRECACPEKTWPTPYGLGQVITAIDVGGVEDMSFLSKTFHYNGGKLYCHPNYRKVLETKEYYTGHNLSIHANPYEYMDSKLK